MGDATPPDWDLLFELASSQSGHFTTQQAAEAGYSPQLLVHHLHAGRMIRVRRGVYHLVHFPASDHEELTVLWLWSEQAGVISHHTALALHHLSDLLPSNVHMTLPPSWKKRRLQVPDGVVLHYEEVAQQERRWFGAIPATSPLRTLRDCATAHLSPELLRDATHDALERGLVTHDELELIQIAIKSFGGL